MIPIIKWAGGKRQLLPELKKYLPPQYNIYVEPFLGSAAMFLDLLPDKAVLNDFNPELINVYKSVRDHIYELTIILSKYQNEYNALPTIDEKSAYFYARREEFNARIHNPKLNVEDAALFIFLNKACYNGLYRVNTQGYFNTPFGQHKRISLYIKSSLLNCSEALQHARILNGDFERACRDLKEGDFVYFDSPYYDTFDTYQAGGFPEEDHIRLYNLFVRLSKRGVYCLLSNSDTDFIKNLYKDYNIRIVPVKRMINCNGEKRTGTEVIISNY